jgi:hypothetical protein
VPFSNPLPPPRPTDRTLKRPHSDPRIIDSDEDENGAAPKPSAFRASLKKTKTREYADSQADPLSPNDPASQRPYHNASASVSFPSFVYPASTHSIQPPALDKAQPPEPASPIPRSKQPDSAKASSRDASARLIDTSNSASRPTSSTNHASSGPLPLLTTTITTTRTKPTTGTKKKAFTALQPSLRPPPQLPLRPKAPVVVSKASPEDKPISISPIFSSSQSQPPSINPITLPPPLRLRRRLLPPLTLALTYIPLSSHADLFSLTLASRVTRYALRSSFLLRATRDFPGARTERALASGIERGVAVAQADLVGYYAWRMREWKARERVVKQSWLRRICTEVFCGRRAGELVVEDVMKGCGGEVRECEVAWRFVLARLAVWVNMGGMGGGRNGEEGSKDLDADEQGGRTVPGAPNDLFGKVVEVEKVVDGVAWRVVVKRRVGVGKEQEREGWLILEAVSIELLTFL